MDMHIHLEAWGQLGGCFCQVAQPLLLALNMALAVHFAGRIMFEHVQQRQARAKRPRQMYRRREHRLCHFRPIQRHQ